MKTELFEPVLAWLDAGAPHTNGLIFSMEDFSTKEGCGTACCIAGAVNQFNNLGVTTDIDATEACFKVGRMIGMTSDQINNLFFAHTDYDRFYDLEDIPPALAAEMLRTFIKTGHAPWPEDLPE